MPSDELASEADLPEKCVPSVLLLCHSQGMTKKKEVERSDWGLNEFFLLSVFVLVRLNFSNGIMNLF